MQRLEVSGAVRPIYWSLAIKGLFEICYGHSDKINYFHSLLPFDVFW